MFRYSEEQFFVDKMITLHVCRVIIIIFTNEDGKKVIYWTSKKDNNLSVTKENVFLTQRVFHWY